MSDSHSPLYETIYDPKRPARAPKSSEGGRHFICFPADNSEGAPHCPADGIGDYEWRNSSNIWTGRAREAARAAQCSRDIRRAIEAIESIAKCKANAETARLRAISFARACGYPENPS